MSFDLIRNPRATQASFAPLMRTTFATPFGIPDAMRAILAQSDAVGITSGQGLIEAVALLAKDEARDAEAAPRAEA